MTSFDFHTQTHGKWILAGEHAVLRGATALVFPIMELTLSLDYQKTTDSLKAHFEGAQSEELPLLFWGVLEQGLEMLGCELCKQSGVILINNTIPIGSGMGASAALCVAISRWFEYQGLLNNTTVFAFAQRLEHLFHSESSGVDIAGVSHDTGLLYSRHGILIPIELRWQPYWYLTPSDAVGMTNHCVKKVKELMKHHPDLGQRIDQMMQSSVDTAREALESNSPNRLERLASAINQAKICFTQWDLCRGKVEECIGRILQAGAIAAKPTGSGDGGYVLSLWSSPPPIDSELSLTAV